MTDGASSGGSSGDRGAWDVLAVYVGSGFEVLPIDDELYRFYRLVP